MSEPNRFNRRSPKRAKFNSRARPRDKIAQKSRKNVMLAVAATFLVIASSVLAVRAYLVASTATKTNNFSPITYTNISIDEGGTTDTDGNYLYNASVDKTAQVTNANANNKPVYVRVAVVVEVYDTSGTNVTADYNYTASFTLGDYWYEGSDGYYYFTYAIDPGESTTSVFGSNVVLYDGGTAISELPSDVSYVNIVVIADAIQAVAEDSEPAEGESWNYTTSIAEGAWGISGILNASTTTTASSASGD